MSIHSEHPFLEPADQRRPVRRLRGRWPAGVSVWTCAGGTTASRGRPVGLTVSSMLFADGEPAEVIGLLDPDSDLAEAVAATGRFRVNVLAAGQAAVAEVFAGLAPAPGGVFTVGEWTDDDRYGPRLVDAAAVLAVDLVDPSAPVIDSGWSRLVRGTVVGVELGEVDVLGRIHGRYTDG